MAIRHDPHSIPICYSHHSELHEKRGERNFWDYYEVNPIYYANELWEQYRERTNDTK